MAFGFWTWKQHFYPNNKIVGLSELRAVSYIRWNVVQVMKFNSDRAENIVGKEENADY